MSQLKVSARDDEEASMPYHMWTVRSG